MPESSNLLGTVYISALTLLVLGVTVAAGFLTRWLLVKGQTSAMWRVWARAWEVVQSVTAHVEVHMRPLLMTSISDGKLSREEAEKLKEQAIKLAKESLGEKGLEQVRKFFGTEELFLSGLIERALGTQRKAGTLPPPAPATVPAGP
jgi:hypothetical protein